MTIFVFLSLGLQVLLVVALHSRNKKRMMMEILGTVTFTKQGINFFRCYTNSKQEGHELMSHELEMTFFQACEVFAECIPMAVIQVSNVLELKKVDWIVVGALVTSAMFVSEAVSYMTVSERSERALMKTRNTVRA